LKFERFSTEIEKESLKITTCGNMSLWIRPVGKGDGK
jgi:hypothetical protein